MSCCDWDTFEGGFIRAWHTGSRRAAPPSTMLIDWTRARRDWKRHHCTGFEAASMQLRDLEAEGYYLFKFDPPSRPGDGEGGWPVLAGGGGNGGGGACV